MRMRESNESRFRKPSYCETIESGRQTSEGRSAP